MDPAGEGIWSEWTELRGKRYAARNRRPVLPAWVRNWLPKCGVPGRLLTDHHEARKDYADALRGIVAEQAAGAAKLAAS
jgi:hypothetical protein